MDTLKKFCGKIGLVGLGLALSAGFPLAYAAYISLANNHILVGQSNGAAKDVAMTGDVAIVATGATTIQPAAVSLSKMANLAANSLIGNNTGSPATPVALTVAQVNTLLGSLSNPMTTLGDTLYENSTPAVTRLPGDVSNNRVFLREQASGGVAQAPAWDTLVAGDIPNLAASKITSGALAAARGGTAIDTSGSTGYPSIASGTWSVASVANTFITLFESVATTGGDLIYGGASGTPTRLANGSAGQALTSAGGTSAPTWSNPNTQTYYLGTQLGVGGGWASTTNGYATPSVATTSNTLTQIQKAGFATVSAEATKLPGITVNFPYVGCYEVSAMLSVAGNTINTNLGAKLRDTTNSVDVTGGTTGATGVSSDQIPITLEGLECVAATGNATIVVQVNADGTHQTSITQAAINPITWKIHGL